MMNMKEENLDYVVWVKSVLDTFVGSKITKRNDYNHDGYNRQPQVTLTSKSHPKLTKMRDRIYIANHKVIDLHLLPLLDAQALTIIFMTEGSTCLDERFAHPHCRISLNTKGFSEADNLALSKAIYEKTQIRTNVHKQNQYRYLSVKTADILLFCETVIPYLLPSFYYKLARIAPAINYKIQQDGEMNCPNWQQLESRRNDETLVTTEVEKPF